MSETNGGRCEECGWSVDAECNCEERKMLTYSLRDFVVESNRIERIEGTCREEMEEYVRFFSNGVTIKSLEQFVDIVANAQLRDVEGLDVEIKGWRPMRGGSHIRSILRNLLEPDNLNLVTPFRTHQEYEDLHPFMDGNGRSGRVLWLHQMGGKAPLGFLHQFYYQTLAALGED